MLLCGIKTGSLICITLRNSQQLVRHAWPENSSSTLISVSEEMYEQMSNEWICVGAFHGQEQIATELTLRLRGEHSISSSSRFIKYLQHFESGNYYTEGSKISVNHLGQSWKVDVVRITGRTSTDNETRIETMNITEDLCESLKGLKLGSGDGDDDVPSGSLRRNREKLDRSALLAIRSPKNSVAETVQKEVNQYTFYCMNSKTKIVVENQEVAGKEVVFRRSPTFENLGGLDKSIEELRQLVKSWLRCSFEAAAGRKRLSGALLHGPPGTGKTATAKAIASENDCYFAVIYGPEMFERSYGGSETKLRNIFKAASSKAPSIIIIDDIHAVCSQSVQNPQESRIVKTLAELLDEIIDKGSRMFVIATTNQLNAVPLLLRSPGRLDKDIKFAIPAASQRKEILESLLTEMKHKLTVTEVNEVVDATHGFVPADLRQLCATAANHALNSWIDSNTDPRDVETAEDKKILQNIAVGANDFFHAVCNTKPSELQEFLVEIPKVHWSDIGGQSEIKRRLCEIIELALMPAQTFERCRIKPVTGILMYGPPGCSKTLIAKALATESKVNFIAVKGPELRSKWVGESERAIRELYRKARAVSPCIVFFDEVDALAADRGSEQCQVGERMVTQLLSEIDGFDQQKNVITVAATNRPDRIDKALMRPGRLQHVVYIPLPDAVARHEIFSIKFRDMPVADDVDVNVLVAKTSRYSGAEVVAVCNTAGYCALEENEEVDRIGMKYFLQALHVVKPRLTDSLIQFYEEYQSRWIGVPIS